MPNEMYEEYAKAYRLHASKYGPDTAIFYQVGKFYEFYDWIDPANGATHTSMKRFVDILGVRMSLRKGEGPKKSDALFAGVPEQSLHKYAAMLTRAGWVVVVYDQVKDWKGNVGSRDVARILTPGTHVEGLSESVEGGAFYFAGVWLTEPAWGSKEPVQFACVCLDLTTGKSITHEGAASGKLQSWTTDDVFHFFQVYLPKECVVWWKGSALNRPTVAELQRKFGLPGVRLEIIDAKEQGGFEIPMVREEFLKRTFSVQSLIPTRESLGLSERPTTERVLCAFFGRVQEHYPSGLKRPHWPDRWVPSMNLSLGNQALFQLNIVMPKMEDSILGMFQRTYTSFGRRAMRRRLLYPTADRAILQARYGEIGAVLNLAPDPTEALRRNLRQIDDLPRLHRRIAEGGITAAEITLLDQSYICARRILETGPLLPGQPISFEQLLAEFHGIFSVEKASKANENAFCFQDEAAPEVTALEWEIRELYALLNSVVATLNRSAKTDGLRLEFREVLAPIITGNKAPMAALSAALKAPGFVAPFPGLQLHQKKSSAHVEIPVLEQTFQKILKKREDLSRAVKTSLLALCGKFADRCAPIWDALEAWIENVDVTCTIATVSKERGLSCPVLDEAAKEPFLQMDNLRHPLIEACITRTEYVKHAVHLGGGRPGGWLIYGMNASGKSSLMKAVGIALILAQSGCYVPATNFRFVPFRTLFTRILNTDNLWAGLSSFAVEMTELREILQKADEHSLVLGDEVCSGTESVSATAIVGASLKWLHRCRSKFVFATHLHMLDTILDDVAAIWHLKVRYDPTEDRLIYDRTLTPGPGSSLYGLEVARAMNLPEEVLGLAHTLRRDLLGTSTEEGAPLSTWNSAIQRRACELCGNDFVKELEVHHIRQRREANGGVFDDGAQRDHVRNLVTVCSDCHDAHHAKTLTIKPLVQTSDGTMRLKSDEIPPSKSVRRAKWTDEQVQQIQEYLRTHPTILPKRAVFDLGELGISISIAGLRTFR
jgi:DNA mismatch repair protein MutS